MRSRPVEPIQSKRVGEEARDPTGEAIELRERVLAQRHEHVDPQLRVEQRRQCVGRRPRAAAV